MVLPVRHAFTLLSLVFSLLPLAACAAPGPRAASVHWVADEAAELPARFARGLVLVETSVNGRPAPPFLLDTGSDATVIDRSLATQFGLQHETKAVARGAGGSVDTGFVRGESLAVGSLQIRRPVFLVLDMSAFERVVGSRVGGIIGMDLLESFALQINYPARQVLLGPSGSLQITNGGKLPLRQREQLYGVDIELGSGSPVSLLIDTGMTGALALDFTEAWQRGVRPDPMRQAQWRVGIGGGGSAQIATAAFIQIAGRAIAQLEMALARPAGGFPGAVGSGLLRYFNFVLDPSAGLLQMSHEPAGLAEHGAPGSSGAKFDFRMEWQRSGIRVESVRPGSPADRAGIRGGDFVISVNGEAVDGLGWRRLRDLLNQRSGAARWTIATPSGPREFLIQF